MMRKNRRNFKRRGFSLVELLIALLLMSIVMIIAMETLKLGAEGYLGTSIQTSIIREDTGFATKLNKMIRESTVVFTIPESSFVPEKLDSEWRYLGIMNDVRIPAGISRTGKEFVAKNALVYIESAGDIDPADDDVPDDCNILQTKAGAYVCQKILAYSFTDSKGYEYTYDLKFNNTDKVDQAATSAAYDFTLKITDESGNNVIKASADADDEPESEAWVDIDEMLNALNAIQVVYKGTPRDPARAIAFRPDFMPTYSEKRANTVTVAMILDYSASMNSDINGTSMMWSRNPSRLSILKDQAEEFLHQLSGLDDIGVNVIWVPFSTYAGDYYVQNTKKITGFPQGKNNSARYKAIQWEYDLTDSNEVTKLESILAKYSTGTGTNLGDGIRMAYKGLQNTANPGAVFVVMITDGEMNSYSQHPKTGKMLTPTNDYDDIPTSKMDSTKARPYAETWGDKLNSTFKPRKSWLIRLYPQELDARGNPVTDADGQCLQRIFGESLESINIEDGEQLGNTFTEIRDNISDVMWAFNGPNMGD